MLRNELFVELSDEQQELVAGGMGYDKLPSIFQLGKTSFAQKFNALKVLKQQYTGAGANGAYTTNSDLIVKENAAVKTNALAVDIIGKFGKYFKKW